MPEPNPTTEALDTLREKLRDMFHFSHNDLWIAAIALEYDLILVTRDSHFDEVESLQTEYW